MKEKNNRHEKSESKSFEKKEKVMKTEPEYQTPKSRNAMNGMKKNYKGKMC